MSTPFPTPFTALNMINFFKCSSSDSRKNALTHIPRAPFHLIFGHL